MRIAVQIGHVNGKGGAAFEEETLRLLYPHVVNRLRSMGHEVGEFDGSLEYEPGNWQYDYDGAVFLHCDSGTKTSTGFSIGYWEEQHPGSKALAAVLKDVYGKASGLKFIGFNITIGEHHYYGNRRFAHSCKCTLIECGFVSNSSERAYLQKNAVIVGQAIADAYIQFFGGTQPEEGEADMMFIPPQKMPKQGDDFVWEFVEGFNQLALYNECHTWLNLYNEGTKDITVKWYTAPSIGEQKVKLGAWERKSIPLTEITKAKGIKDGFTTVVKCTSDALASGVSVFAK